MVVDFRRGLRVQMTVQSTQRKRTFSAVGAEAVAKRKIDAWTTVVLGALAEYPPEPSDSHYRRTGNLGLAWHARYETHGGAIAVVFENRVNDGGKYYARWVMGDSGIKQSPMFNHWRPAKEIVLGHRAQWERIVREIVRDAIRAS